MPTEIPETAEEWRSVVGWEGLYEVSDLGRVRSLDRTISNPLPSGTVRSQRIKGRILTPGIAKAGGYGYVNLTRNARQTSRHVHRLVMDAFVGPLPSGLHTRHLNGDPTDSRLVNLAYGTPLENARDAVRHGRTGANRTHCKRKHEFTPENTHVVIQPSGYQQRNCRACARARYHERRGAA